jgi:hypothetical protein
MHFSKKAKYFACGAVAAMALAPLAIRAVETIPLTFAEGDVISASVMNALLGRINDVQRGFASGSDLVGTWSCTTYSTRPNYQPQMCATGFVKSPGGFQYSRTQDIVFACDGGNCTATAASFSPGTCGDASNLSSPYEVNGNVMASTWGVDSIQKLNPGKFIWQVHSSLPQMEYVVCEKKNLPPAPADAVKATATSKTVVVSWTDQSMDATGFKVQRKASADDAWSTVTTTDANATSFTDAGLKAGKYWYRIIATNNNGDAMSSSEVQVEVS